MFERVALTEHPRSRGENCGVGLRVLSALGTSPLTRGKLHLIGLDKILVRNIPAHAGKTSPTSLRIRWKSEHPRSRGENTNAVPFTAAREGTSPLTRGKQQLTSKAIATSRNIPAHAGKTTPGRPRLTFQREHPRSRGENAEMYVFANTIQGTSPLTRGKLGFQPMSFTSPRNIPAHAGKTQARVR